MCGQIRKILPAIVSLLVLIGSGQSTFAQKAVLAPHQAIRWPESDRWVGRAATFVLDDRALAVRAQAHVELLDVATGRFGQKCMPEGVGFEKSYVGLRWLPDDEQLICWSREAVDVWDLGARRRRSHVTLQPRHGIPESSSKPVLSPDGKYLFGGQ